MNRFLKLMVNLMNGIQLNQSFPSNVSIKLAVSKENLFLQGVVTKFGKIKKITVELGRLGFSSDTDVSIESITEIEYKSSNSHFVQNGGKFETFVGKDSFSRVAHSPIWFVTLKIEFNDSRVKVLPIFKPAIDFNRNTDFDIHKCHMENSTKAQDFLIINESDLALDIFNPLLQNAIALSYFDHISDVSFSSLNVYGSFPILITREKVVNFEDNFSVFNIDLADFDNLYYSSDVIDRLSNGLFENFVRSFLDASLSFESKKLLDFLTSTVVYSNLLSNSNRTLFIKKYIKDNLFSLEKVIDKSPQRLALLLADKISAVDFIDRFRHNDNLTVELVFDEIRKVLGSSIKLESGYFNEDTFKQSYHPAQSLDDDLDGLYNYFELFLGTKPLLSDSDADGWSDTAEYIQGSLPTMSLEYPKNIVIDGNFGDWVSLNPSLVKYDNRSDEKGCDSKIDLDMFGAALLNSSLLVGISTKHLDNITDLIWEVQIETGDIGKTTVLRASSGSYHWDLFSSDAELVLRQPILSGVGTKDFEAWIPSRLLSTIDRDKVDYLNLRIAIYSSREGSYEMCDDTQWIRIANKKNNN